MFAKIIYFHFDSQEPNQNTFKIYKYRYFVSFKLEVNCEYCSMFYLFYTKTAGTVKSGYYKSADKELRVIRNWFSYHNSYQGNSSLHVYRQLWFVCLLEVSYRDDMFSTIKYNNYICLDEDHVIYHCSWNIQPIFSQLTSLFITTILIADLVTPSHPAKGRGPLRLSAPDAKCPLRFRFPFFINTA